MCARDGRGADMRPRLSGDLAHRRGRRGFRRPAERGCCHPPRPHRDHRCGAPIGRPCPASHRPPACPPAGEIGWYTQRWVVDRYPELATFRGFQDRTLASMFPEPLTFSEHCRGLLADAGGDPLREPYVGSLCEAFYSRYFVPGVPIDLAGITAADADLRAEVDRFARSLFVADWTAAGDLGFGAIAVDAAGTPLDALLQQASAANGGPVFPGHFVNITDASGRPMGHFAGPPCTWTTRDAFLIEATGLKLRKVLPANNVGFRDRSRSLFADGYASWQLQQLLDAGAHHGVPVLFWWFEPNALLGRCARRPHTRPVHAFPHRRRAYRQVPLRRRRLPPRASQARGREQGLLR